MIRFLGLSSFLCCIICFNFSDLHAQRDYDVHWVQFNTKAGTPYSLFHPEEYLSWRALERRRRFDIRIDSTDLPINPEFIKEVLDRGFRLHMKSNWMNGVAVIGTLADVKELKELDYVSRVEAIGFEREGGPGTDLVGRRDYETTYEKHEDFYGDSRNQIKMLNGHFLHRMGLRGDGMHVAVFDGGFTNMRETPAFDSLFHKDQIIYTHDYVQDDDFVFEGSDHGRDVISCMASNLPHLQVGTAPDAFYYLCKTEDDGGEYRIEEYNWLAAIEYADSAGVDLMNSSLGYYDFDDDAMDYAYRDLDGNTTVITQAADLASKKGIMVVTSAGNEGSSKWKHISVPGDADSVLTVGACNRDGYHAKFSSYGFDEHYIIKPNVMARGHMAIVASVGRYKTRYQFGTSFSSPIMAGMVAALWQGIPDYSNIELIRALERYGNQVDDPDTQMGYGVPDVFGVYKELSKGAVVEIEKKKVYYRHPANPEADRLDFVEENTRVGKAEVFLYNAWGELLHQEISEIGEEEVWHAGIKDWKNFPAGVYNAYIKYGSVTKRILLVK